MFVGEELALNGFGRMGAKKYIGNIDLSNKCFSEVRSDGFEGLISQTGPWFNSCPECYQNTSPQSAIAEEIGEGILRGRLLIGQLLN